MNRHTLKNTAYALALAMSSGCKQDEEKQLPPTLPSSAAFAYAASASASTSTSVPQVQAPKRQYMYAPLQERPQVAPGQKVPNSLLLLGDSMLYGVMETNRLAVPVENIRSLTEIGRFTYETRAALMAALSSDDPMRINPGSIERVVVLSGTNDIGATKGIKPEHITAELRKLYQILHENRMAILALTIPPFKGYKPYMPKFDEIEERRQFVNRSIHLFDVRHPDWDFQVLDLAATEANGGMADNEDPLTLGPSAKAEEDHLHISKTALAERLNEWWGIPKR